MTLDQLGILIGIATGTAGSWLGYSNHRRSSVKADVSGDFRILIPGDSEPQEHTVVITVTNSGHTPFSVASVGFSGLRKNSNTKMIKTSRTLEGQGLPCEILPGRRVTFKSDLDSFNKVCLADGATRAYAYLVTKKTIYASKKNSKNLAIEVKKHFT